jgi:hypothetical protein
MKLLKSIRNIVKGWWLLMVDTPASWILNAKRKKHCQVCPLRNKYLNVCNDCGCFLPAKRRVEEEQCPQGKW